MKNFKIVPRIPEENNTFTLTNDSKDLGDATCDIDIVISKGVMDYIEYITFHSRKMNHLKRNYDMIFMDVRNFNCAIEECERKTKLYLKKITARLKSLKKINRKV